MSRWFRLDDDVVHDRKVQDLSPANFKGWINVLCIASKHGGILPASDDVAFALRLPLPKASKLINDLSIAGLIDRMEDGRLCPHNWEKRQHKSDLSTDRVQAHRERKKNANGKFHETN
jgi:hypothetical protein